MNGADRHRGVEGLVFEREALRELGVDLRYDGAEDHHPLTVRADGINGGHVTLDAGLSSQFLAALLLVGPLTAKGSRSAPPASSPCPTWRSPWR